MRCFSRYTCKKKNLRAVSSIDLTPSISIKTKVQQDTKDAEEAATAEKIQADIEAKKAAFQREVESKKAQLSADEYKRLLTKHDEEIAELSRKANVQQLRQGQNLQDKLDARRRRRDGVNSEKVDTCLISQLLNH